MLEQKHCMYCWLVTRGGVMSVFIMMGIVMMQQWSPCKTSYVYAPGLFGSPVVIGRYCPYYSAPTGEEIHGTRGGNVLGDGTAISSVVFPEVNITQSSHWFRKYIAPLVTRNVFFSFFGIVVKENSAAHETFIHYLPEVGRANIGQQEDIAALRTCLHEHIQKFPRTNIVLFGDSRGAATIFNFLALDHPPVACAVLEGVFDSIPHLIKHCWRWRTKHASIERALHTILRTCTSRYAPEGPFPIDYTAQIPLDTPLLLVTSLRDEIVPYQSTMRLYCHVVERGHNNVHLLILKHSSHKGYMIGKDRTAYESCVHAFYEAYGVAYDVKKAALGSDIFAGTQPSVAELREQYQLDAPCCQ